MCVHTLSHVHTQRDFAWDMIYCTMVLQRQIYLMCVCGAWPHIVHTQSSLSVFTDHARHSCSVFTALWCSCSVVKLTFYFHQNPSWLWLAWANLPAWLCSPTRIWTNLQVGTTVQIMPGLYRIRSIVNTHVKFTNTQTLPYPRY